MSPRRVPHLTTMEEIERLKAPSDSRCPLCEEPLTVGELADAPPIGVEGGVRPAHRECLLRAVMGGIGHLEDHAYWCGQMHDPDGGRSFRLSALAVDAWVRAHGIPL